MLTVNLALVATATLSEAYTALSCTQKGAWDALAEGWLFLGGKGEVD